MCIFIYLPSIYLLSQPDTLLPHHSRRKHFWRGGEETQPPLPHMGGVQLKHSQGQNPGRSCRNVGPKGLVTSIVTSSGTGPGHLATGSGLPISKLGIFTPRGWGKTQVPFTGLCTQMSVLQSPFHMASQKEILLFKWLWFPGGIAWVHANAILS